MIDTEKYEGHTPAPWEYNTDDDGWTLAAIRERDDPDRDEFIVLITKPEGNPHLTMNPDLELMADAPLLLAEVKQLREEVMFLVDLEEFSKDEKYIIHMKAEVERLRRLLQAVLDNADEADLDNEVYLFLRDYQSYQGDD